jgi:hypothetical protein
VRSGNVVTGLGMAPYSALRLEETETNNRSQQKQYILYPEPNMFVLSAPSFQRGNEMCCFAKPHSKGVGNLRSRPFRSALRRRDFK